MSVATDNSDKRNPSGRSEGLFDRLLTLFRLKSVSTAREDLADALDENGTSESFSPQEQAMLRNVLQLGETRVVDVMVPRADIIALAAESSLGDLLASFRNDGHSRLPVYGDTLDDPKGMIHIRDFLDFIAGRAEVAAKETRRGRTRKAGEAPAVDPAVEPARTGMDLGAVDLSAPIAAANLMRPVLYVPPSMPALDLLVRMQATRTHMALVIDEYGGTDGLVSIEDLVEVVVGQIEDEHDEAESAMVQTIGGAVMIDARASVEEVAAALGVDFSAADEAEEVDTIGGYVVTLAGRVPVRGEIVSGPEGLEFEITDADPRKIKRLKVARVIEKPAPETATDAPAAAAG
jgi:CBS domain containing-hemolysin-like protein